MKKVCRDIGIGDPTIDPLYLLSFFDFASLRQRAERILSHKLSKHVDIEQ